MNDNPFSVPPAPSKPAPAISQAAAILRVLASATEPLGVVAIARAATVSPSSCFNLLKALTDERLVEFDGETKKYRLGLGVVDLARSVLRGDAVLAVARDRMQAIADRHEAAVGLWRQSGPRRATLLALRESEAATRIHMAIGQRQPLAAGATGRAFLSYADPDQGELRSLFDDVRWQKPLAFATYRGQLASARKCGFAIDADWLLSGITTVAAALAGDTGRSRYSLSATMFSGRHSAEALDRIGADLAACAAQIESQLLG